MVNTDAYLLIEENARKVEFRQYTETYFGDIPFSGITRFSKFKVAPGQSVSKYYTNKTLILPIRGAFDISPECILIPGEYWMLSNELTILQNVSDAQEAVFIVFEFNHPLGNVSRVEKITPDLASGGKMMPGFGLFKYREEIALHADASNFFIHVIAGNFEAEDRYLSEGDTLILLNAGKTELECLASHGLFLFFNT